MEVEENGVSAGWMSLGVVADELRDGRRCIERVVVGELVIFWLLVEWERAVPDAVGSWSDLDALKCAGGVGLSVHLRRRL